MKYIFFALTLAFAILNTACSSGTKQNNEQTTVQKTETPVNITSSNLEINTVDLSLSVETNGENFTQFIHFPEVKEIEKVNVNQEAEFLSVELRLQEKIFLISSEGKVLKNGDNNWKQKFNADGTIAKIKDGQGNQLVKFKYENGKLAKIKNGQEQSLMKFKYENNALRKIKDGAERDVVKLNLENNRLVKIKDAQEAALIKLQYEGAKLTKIKDSDAEDAGAFKIKYTDNKISDTKSDNCKIEVFISE